MIARFATVLLALTAVPVAGWAQDTTSKPEISAAAEAFLDKLPATLGGAVKPEDRKPGMPVMYIPKQMMKDPIILALARPWDKPETWPELRDSARGSFHETGIRSVVREGRFSSPGTAGASTFYGEYVTRMGLKQIWVSDHQGIRTNLIATIFRREDADKLREEVAVNVFGGATITDAPSDAPAAPSHEHQD